MQAPNPVSARSETDRLLDRLHRAALSDDGREMHAVGRDYLRSPNGQAWQQDVQEYSQAAQTREQQAAWEAQQLQQAAEQMHRPHRSEEHTSELQSLMRISYAVFCLKKTKNKTKHDQTQRLNT